MDFKQDTKLTTFDWMCGVPDVANASDYVEVQFKNTRKGYYLNSEKIPLEKGDVVAVEASPGHDIGTVTLTGRLVLLQMKKCRVRAIISEAKKIYRKAKPADIEKYEEAKAKEHSTMIRSRQLAADLKLNMKIGDVEYQGDGNKAIFYYIADERVDFRLLIRVLADAFRVRIEMKQIGARQEAGRIGGIGPCGRALCCSQWMTSFVSVSTSAARYQDISMNPQKLAGQCAKLKCCMNFEVDAYMEAHKRMPSKEIVLETKDATYYHFKSDILKRESVYSTDKSFAANLVTVPASRVFDVIAMNKKGIKPIALDTDEVVKPPKRDALDILGQDSLTRFDSPSKPKKKRRPSGSENDRPSTPNRERTRGNSDEQRAEQRRPSTPNRERTRGNSDEARAEQRRPSAPNRERTRGNSDEARAEQRRPSTPNRERTRGNSDDPNAEQRMERPKRTGRPLTLKLKNKSDASTEDKTPPNNEA